MKDLSDDTIKEMMKVEMDDCFENRSVLTMMTIIIIIGINNSYDVTES